MDISYYMLGALGLLLVGLIIYLFVALVRYRMAVKRVRAVRAAEAEGEARYLSASDAATVFPSATTEPSPTPDALESKVYDFTLPAVHHAAAVVTPEPEPAPAPEPAPEPEPALELKPEPAPEPERALELELALELEPAPTPAPEATPEPAPEPAPAPAPAPAAEVAPEPALESTPPSVDVVPGYSLADELERLMLAADAAPQPLLTPAEHSEVIATPAPVVQEPPFTPAVEPVFPMPSVGQALSSASAPASPQQEYESSEQELPVAEWESRLILEPEQPTVEQTSAPTDAVPAAVVQQQLADTTPVHSEQDAEVAGYTLVGPVELHFTLGGGRIGVKPGTRSFEEFQRLAGILLDDLRAARGW